MSLFAPCSTDFSIRGAISKTGPQYGKLKRLPKEVFKHIASFLPFKTSPTAPFIKNTSTKTIRQGV